MNNKKLNTEKARGGGRAMRARIITLFYTIEAYMDDFAYWVIGKGEDNTERTIKTFWGTHYMGD